MRSIIRQQEKRQGNPMKYAEQPENFSNRAKIFKALGHPTRLYIIELLNKEGKRCVCELTEILGYDISTISKHLAVLKDACLVTTERKGNLIIYSSLIPCISNVIECIECRYDECCTVRTKEPAKSK
jgi:DNA-binding transcriptional ArsR family regulator